MPTSIVALQILLILLPGFAAAAIVDSLAVRGTQTDFQRVVSACLHSFVIYAIFVSFYGGRLPFSVRGADTETPVFVWDLRRVWTLLAITIVISLVSTAYINLDGNRLCRRLRLTERTTRQSIWNDTFEELAKKRQIVQVETGDGKSVIGLLEYYSDNADDCSVFVSQAAWVTADGETIEIPGPGILLTKNAGIRSISLLTSPGEPES
jgi:hypothetical protein